uniref:NADPH oxidase organizer 1b n=1 Tax=Lates calcarifer TaxID=8187 RepID=A0A4W6GBU5_LATCA
MNPVESELCLMLCFLFQPLQMFMISVLWSDETEVIIYRSFQDFKKFHVSQNQHFFCFSQERQEGAASSRKGSKRSVRRMKFLESYCDELLKCEQNVTQSSEVTQFFMPKDQDLQPDFTKNSVTHPFVTQTYRCVATYETKDTKNLPFKVAVDEKLDVLIKDPAGWWLVENEEKRLAWFPAPYLELPCCYKQPTLRSALYCAVRSYSTKKDDEVSVSIGSVVEVLRKSDNGWWLIRYPNDLVCLPDRSLSDRRSSNTSSESSGSVRSEGSDGAPRVPPRPKTEEILNRCTTMTRKAALATKTRLQIQPEPMHSR